MRCFLAICHVVARPPAAGKGKQAMSSQRIDQGPYPGYSIIHVLICPLPVLKRIWSNFLGLLSDHRRHLEKSRNYPPTGLPVGHDFVTFWAASELARHGDPLTVYSPATMHLMEQAVIGAKIPLWPWSYPPTFLLMVWPLSLGPYLFSYATWIVGTLCGYPR